MFALSEKNKITISGTDLSFVDKETKWVWSLDNVELDGRS